MTCGSMFPVRLGIQVGGVHCGGAPPLALAADDLRLDVPGAAGHPGRRHPGRRHPGRRAARRPPRRPPAGWGDSMACGSMLRPCGSASGAASRVQRPPGRRRARSGAARRPGRRHPGGARWYQWLLGVRQVSIGVLASRSAASSVRCGWASRSRRHQVGGIRVGGRRGVHAASSPAGAGRLGAGRRHQAVRGVTRWLLGSPAGLNRSTASRSAAAGPVRLGVRAAASRSTGGAASTAASSPAGAGRLDGLRFDGLGGWLVRLSIRVGVIQGRRAARRPPQRASPAGSGRLDGLRFDAPGRAARRPGGGIGSSGLRGGGSRSVRLGVQVGGIQAVRGVTRWLLGSPGRSQSNYGLQVGRRLGPGAKQASRSAASGSAGGAASTATAFTRWRWATGHRGVGGIRRRCAVLPGGSLGSGGVSIGYGLRAAASSVGAARRPGRRHPGRQAARRLPRRAPRLALGDSMACGSMAWVDAPGAAGHPGRRHPVSGLRAAAIYRSVRLGVQVGVLGPCGSASSRRCADRFVIKI